MAAHYRLQNRATLIFDPNLDHKLWGLPAQNNLVTDDMEVFLQHFFNTRGLAVFIDESREAKAAHDVRVLSVATRGRHFGHKVHFIGQRAKMMHPDIREQCTTLFCFNQALDSARELAYTWNEPELENAPFLQRGEFYHKMPFTPIKKLRAF